jgi:hypothetical protein
VPSADDATALQTLADSRTVHVAPKFVDVIILPPLAAATNLDPSLDEATDSKLPKPSCFTHPGESARDIVEGEMSERINRVKVVLVKNFFLKSISLLREFIVCP